MDGFQLMLLCKSISKQVVVVFLGPFERNLLVFCTNGPYVKLKSAC